MVRIEASTALYHSCIARVFGSYIPIGIIQPACIAHFAESASITPPFPKLIQTRS